jgi:hypothetical protein
MKRYSFHPRRFVVSVLFVPALFGLLVLLALVGAVDVAKVLVPFLGFILFGALLILPAWVMQPRETPPPRGRGRASQPLAVVRPIRRRDDRPPIDRAARIAVANPI